MLDTTVPPESQKRFSSANEQQLNQKRQVKMKTCADVYDHWRTCKRLYKKAPKDGVEFQVDYIDTGFALNDEQRSKMPIALALHGAPGSYHDFKLLINHLSQQKIRVIAPNFPEYIATVKTKVLFRHSADEKAAYLRDFLKAINVNKIDLLVSHSSAIFPTLLILLNANKEAIAKQKQQQLQAKGKEIDLCQQHDQEENSKIVNAIRQQKQQLNIGDVSTGINEENLTKTVFKGNGNLCVDQESEEDGDNYDDSDDDDDDNNNNNNNNDNNNNHNNSYEDDDGEDNFEDAKDEIDNNNNNNNSNNSRIKYNINISYKNNSNNNDNKQLVLQQIDDPDGNIIQNKQSKRNIRNKNGKRKREKRSQDVIVKFDQPIEIKAVALFNPAGHRLPKSMKPTWFKCGSVHIYQHKLGRSLFRKFGPAFLTVVGVPVHVDNMDNVMLSATVMRNSKCQRVVKQLEQLSQLKMPTLLVFSENDKLIEKEIFYEMSQFMKLDTKNFDIFSNDGDIELSRSNVEDWIRVMVFKAGGHYAYSNYAKTVNKAVSELLDKVVKA